MIWHLVIIVIIGTLADYFELIPMFDFIVLAMLAAIYNAVWNLYKSVTWVEIEKYDE